MKQKERRSYYETLDVDPHASEKEIAVAYRRVSAFLSPDTLALYNIRDPQEIQDLKREVDEAFWVLSDAHRRSLYDAEFLGAQPMLAESLEHDEPAVTLESMSTSVALVLPDVVDGPFLRMTRESQSLSLDRVANLTKIGRHHLISIESNDFSSLPAEIYVRGFVQQMARVLGLDPSQTTKAFLTTFRQQRSRR